MTIEEQIELSNLNLVLNDRFISQGIEDDVLDTILKRYRELVSKLLTKYKLLTDLNKNPLPD